MLDIPSIGDLSLYLHIPFCTTCCSYCAFYSEPKQPNLAFIDRYVNRLEEEIKQCTAQRTRFNTVFVGGGNPGSLSVEQLRRLLVASRAFLSDEVTIEMNPETFSESFFELFAEGLVSRLSMGIQSMDDGILTKLGRNARRKDNLRSLQLAKDACSKYGIELSFDLMVCLPGQTVEQAIADVHEIFSLTNANHISLYCLTVEEGTDLSMQVGLGQTEVLDEDGQQRFLEAMWAELGKLEFEHYEVSNFCRNGKKSKHNLVYWRLDNYIGLGSSAASTIRDSGFSKHYTQVLDLKDFAVQKPFSGYEEELLTPNQQVEEYLMMALRTNAGIDKNIMHKRYGIVFDEYFSSAIASLDSSWFFNSVQFFILNEYGFMVLDEILLRFVLAIR